jgi:carbon-monoxide dehydrogenase medium subunit
MYAFTFHRPTTVRQAVNLLAKHEDAKLLAGGHSLIPVMKLRLANPPLLIDLSKVEGISGVELKGRSIVVGAMTRHVEVANSQVAKDNLPALAMVPGSIGDPHVREARNDRRIGRQQRSKCGLSCRLPGPRRDHHHLEAQNSGR